MRTDDDVVLPASHPASPEARPGVVLAGSAALEPELVAVVPDIASPAAPKSSSQPPATAHGQHKH